MCRPIVCVVHILTMLQRKSCYINIFHVKMPYKLNRPICCSRYYDKQQQLSKQITSDSFYSLFLFFSTSRCKTGDTRIPLSLMHFNKGFFLSRILRYLVSVTDEIRVQLREGHTGVCNALLTYSLLIFQPRSSVITTWRAVSWARGMTRIWDVLCGTALWAALRVTGKMARSRARDAGASGHRSHGC